MATRRRQASVSGYYPPQLTVAVCAQADSAQAEVQVLPPHVQESPQLLQPLQLPQPPQLLQPQLVPGRRGLQPLQLLPLLLV